MDPSRQKSREQEWVREALSGRREAFGNIFRSHRDRAFGLAFHYTRNKEDALDVVQEAFIRAYEHLNKFDVQKQFGPWLLAIVRNLSIDLIRRRKRLACDELSPNLSDSRKQLPADQALLRTEIRAQLNHLPSRQREIIFLKDYQGHTYSEIAQIMSIPIGTVMSRLHHARKKLRDLVKGVPV